MKLGILLLNQKNVYLTATGLPESRPRWDKEFLTNLVDGMKVTCSKETLVKLPKSITDKCYITTGLDYDINLGISTFKDKVDLLIIVRTRGEEDGKQFRLDDYKLILKKGELEIWKAK